MRRVIRIAGEDGLPAFTWRRRACNGERVIEMRHPGGNIQIVKAGPLDRNVAGEIELFNWIWPYKWEKDVQAYPNLGTAQCVVRRVALNGRKCLLVTRSWRDERETVSKRWYDLERSCLLTRHEIKSSIGSDTTEITHARFHCGGGQEVWLPERIYQRYDRRERPHEWTWMLVYARVNQPIHKAVFSQEALLDGGESGVVDWRFNPPLRYPTKPPQEFIDRTIKGITGIDDPVRGAKPKKVTQ